MEVNDSKSILDDLIEKVIENKIEARIEILGDGSIYIDIAPWKPFEWKCPYQ